MPFQLGGDVVNPGPFLRLPSHTNVVVVLIRKVEAHMPASKEPCCRASSYDRFVAGEKTAMSEAAQRGYALFKDPAKANPLASGRRLQPVMARAISVAVPARMENRFRRSKALPCLVVSRSFRVMESLSLVQNWFKKWANGSGAGFLPSAEAKQNLGRNIIHLARRSQSARSNRRMPKR